MWSYALVTSWLPVEQTELFVIVEGVIRVSVFIAYILFASAGYLAGQIAHAGEVMLPFRHAYGATRVEEIKSVRATQHIVVCRHDQSVGDTAAGLGLEEVVHLL